MINMNIYSTLSPLCTMDGFHVWVCTQPIEGSSQVRVQVSKDTRLLYPSNYIISSFMQQFHKLSIYLATITMSTQI